MDNLLAGYRTIQAYGLATPQRNILNIGIGLGVEDNGSTTTSITVFGGQFGIAADGVTNDTAALAAAIAAASTAQGGNAIVQLPAGIILTDAITLTQAANSGITLKGASASTTMGTGRTIIKLRTSSSYLLQVQGQNYHFEDIWFHGNGIASNVVELIYFTNLVHFERCVFSNATPTSGNLVSMPGTLEVTKVQFDQCYFVQDPLNGSVYCNALVSITNSDANSILFHSCYFSNAAYVAYMIQGCASFKHCLAFAFTTACFAFECTNLACEIFDVYTESTNEPFALELNTLSGTSGPDPIRFVHCNIQDNAAASSYEVFQLICKQPIILEDCLLGGDVSVAPDATAGVYRPLLSRCVFQYDATRHTVLGVVGHPEFVNIRDCQLVYDSYSYFNGGPAKVLTFSQDVQKSLNPIAFKWVPDAVTFFDASIGSGSSTLASAASSPFSSQDIGKDVIIPGAGSGGARYVGVIQTFVDANHVTVSPAASTAVSSARCDVGTASATQIVNIGNAQTATGLPIEFQPGAYLVTGAYSLGACIFQRGAYLALANMAVLTATGRVRADYDAMIASSPQQSGGTLSVTAGVQEAVGSNWIGGSIAGHLSYAATCAQTGGCPVVISLQNQLVTKTALTWGSATNDLAAPTTNVVEVTGPTGAFTFSGIAPADSFHVDGETYDFVFLVNEQLTVQHLSGNSSTANQIQCPAGANLVLSAPGSGGYHTLRLRYSKAANSGSGAFLVLDYE